MQPWRLQSREVATCRFETGPGEQAQVDGASFGRWEGPRLSAFVMTLGYSRMKYLEFPLTQDLETFLTCHLHAFAAFGGVPQTLRYDHLKSVVLHRDASGIRFHPRFLDFAAVFGVLPRRCQPGRPQTKGKVENAVGYVKGSFWPGRRFTDLADLNHPSAGLVCDRGQRPAACHHAGDSRGVAAGRAPPAAGGPDR